MEPTHLKFAHFTANQAILEAFRGKNRVHVIDFSIKQGMQWPALMQALALRAEGPPAFRLTGIGPPAPDNSDWLQAVGWKLAQFADSIDLHFEYRGFIANNLTDLQCSMLDLRTETEAVAISSVFEVQPVLHEKVLELVKEVNPVIMTVVELEPESLSDPAFLDRFNQVCKVVACEGEGEGEGEGSDRVERHERLAQWRTRFGSVGLEPVHLGSNALKQASMLLELFEGEGDGYGVEESEGCLMLGWHSRPLITTSAWQLAEEIAANSGNQLSH